jgi:hypothetical protein
MKFVIFLLSSLGIAQALESTVVRANYGVAMHRTSTANLAASSWGHTFVIPFISDPPEPEEIDVPWPEEIDVPCGRLPADKAVDICNEIIKTAEAFRVSQNKVIFIIKTNLNLVKTLKPRSHWHLKPVSNRLETDLSL